MPAKRNAGEVSATQAGTVRSSADVSLGRFMHEAPSIRTPTYAAGGIPAGQEEAKGKEQSNLGAFNIKPKYPPHADDALVRQKVCSAVCALAVAKYNRSCLL